MSKNKYGDWKNEKIQSNTYQQLNSKYDKALKDGLQQTNNTRHFENYIKRRESQIKKQQEEEKKTDFNVYNYDIEELAAILNFEYIPINKGIINRRILELKRKFKNQEKHLIFFDNAEKRLLEHSENVNAETWTEVYEKETSEAGKVLTDRFQSQNEEQEKAKINQIINKEKNIIGQVRKPLDQTYAPKGVVQGKKNPFEIQEISRIVNFDSSHRQFLPNVSTSCENPDNGNVPIFTTFLDPSSNQKRLYTSTNYIVNLSQPLTNVISITLDHVEIPNVWYTFSPAYGTDSFTFKIKGGDHEYTITLEEGNYSQQQLVTEINEQIWNIQDPPLQGISAELLPPWSPTTPIYKFRGYYDVSGNYPPSPSTSRSSWMLPFPLLEFKYTPHNNKIKICNHFVVPTIIEFKWYNTEKEKIACSAKQESEAPQPGGKVNYNLGWLLGFRGQSSIVYNYRYWQNRARWWSNINGTCHPTYTTTSTYSIPTVDSPGSGSDPPIPTSTTTVVYRNTVPNRSRTPPKFAWPRFMEDNTVGDKMYSGYTIPKSTVDIKGPRTFILVLDDFNNNKPNKDLISIIDTVDTRIKQPSYYKSQTMSKKYGKGKYQKYDSASVGIPGYECVDVADEGNDDRECSTNELNKDLSSNLTKAQQYTVSEIENGNSKWQVQDIFNSPNSPDVLSLFPVVRNPLDNDSSIIYKNPDKLLQQRKYFGPVKLVKFGVKLLNDKGFEVDLSDRDWSFSIIVKQLYQY